EPPHTSAALNECQGNSRQATCGSSARDQSKADRSNCRMARDADADQKDQRTDRSRAACDWMARTRRGKIRKKAYPASRADRPSSPKSPGCQSSRESQRRADREPFFNEIRQKRKSIRRRSPVERFETRGDVPAPSKRIISIAQTAPEVQL